MTNAIHRRVAEHKQKIVPGFTKKYSCTKLVHVEVFATAYDAIAREKQIKGGSRRKKIALVMKDNLAWKDLTDEI
jgi:putative endonuclease